MTDPYDPTTYSEAELREALEEAKRDLQNAARDEPESEWHEACFAGVLVLAAELQSRGLSASTVH
jgi:hypothetical protein